MAGEDSVRSGRDGEKIANEILKLIGWGSASYNINIDCAFPSRHKSENRKQSGTHGLDILYSYDNPLYHDNRDVVIGSVKHYEKGYPQYPSTKKSDLTEFLQDLAVNLDCARQSDDIVNLIGNSSLKTNYKGLLFCFSSLDSELEYDFVEHIDNNIEFGKNNFEEIFVVDNKRATFLVSSIKNATSYMSGATTKFIYQNTGKNMEKSQLLLSGEKLPVQLINSEIIPIVKEDREKISCLIFCNNPYSKENVSRLIWLSHKLCGLTNEIRIYLPNYDDNKQYEINGVKQLFKDEAFTTKITFHRFLKYDIVSLKESQINLNSSAYVYPPKNAEIVHSNIISDDIDKILPFGDFLIPKLRTSILSEVNLKSFLFRKGIVTLNKTKNDILPLFSCLLLSPEELDGLKKTYKEKEDKPKEIERKARIRLNNISLWEAFNTFFPSLKELAASSIPKNCNLLDNPKLERVNADYNHLKISYKIEKENTNKDFLTGKTFHDAEIEIKYDNKTEDLIFIERHTSSETYKTNKNYYDSFQKSLKKNNLLIEDFKSIKFLDFDNNKRIQFLLSFLEIRESKVFTIKNITLESMKLKADEEIDDIPKDLESWIGKVSALNLYGKQLNDTIYLSDERYRKAVLCEKVKFNIVYTYLNRSGICCVEISFQGALKANGGYNDTELLISITPNNNSFDNNFFSTKQVFNKEVHRIKENSYNKFKQDLA